MSFCTELLIYYYILIEYHQNVYEFLSKKKSTVKLALTIFIFFVFFPISPLFPIHISKIKITRLNSEIVSIRYMDEYLYHYYYYKKLILKKKNSYILIKLYIILKTNKIIDI